MKDLVIKAQTGDKQAVKTLWDKVKGLAYKKCFIWYNKNPNRFKKLGLSEDDLIQECYIAMVDCLEHYKDDKGMTFGNYFYNYYVTLKLSELAGLRNKKDSIMINASSLEQHKESDEEYSILDIIEDETATYDFENIENKIKVKQLHTVLDDIMTKELTHKEHQVINNIYYQNMTLKQNTFLIGITIERIRQIQKNALKKLGKPQYKRVLAGYLYYDVDMTNLAYKTSVERTAEKLERKRQEQEKFLQEYFENKNRISSYQKTAG